MMWFTAKQWEVIECAGTRRVLTKVHYTWMKNESTYEIKAERGFNQEILGNPDMEPILELVNA